MAVVIWDGNMDREAALKKQIKEQSESGNEAMKSLLDRVAELEAKLVEKDRPVEKSEAPVESKEEPKEVPKKKMGRPKKSEIELAGQDK